MRKSLSVPVAALLVGGVAGGVAAPVMAAPAAAETSNKPRPADRASRTKASLPISVRYVKRYRLGPQSLREIRAAKVWATTWKARSVRQCESGGYYGINTGNGYYGAYQFLASTWRGVGGGRYAAYPHQAPKFAQDHMAYRLWKRSGWGPWGCA